MHSFLYVLSWRTGEDYADITLLSMTFLREVHPEAQIQLLSDPETAGALRDASHPLLSLTDRLIEAEAPHHTSAMKSWYLKTRMRSLVDGDFIFLDGDTIVRQRLDVLFTMEAPIAMAENHSLRFPDNLPEMERVVFERNGWPIPSYGHFLNSGVICWKDVPEARRLATLCEQQWDLSAANGGGSDQPAFNRAIELSGVRYQVLDDHYNAQLRPNPAASVDAAVWHFYHTDNRWFPDDWFSLGLRMIREGEVISGIWIKEVCQARIPWPVTDTKTEARVIEHLCNGGILNSSIIEDLTGTMSPSISNATVCTIITANYLPYALALLESVRSFEPDVHFNIFISDTEAPGFSRTLNDRNVSFHFANDVCKTGIGQLIRNKYQSSDHDAFRWSCKPIFINHLIRVNGYERVLYFDCDIYIFDAFRFLFDALKKHDILLTPHWRSKEPETDPEEYRFLFNHGLYNAGFVGVNAHGTAAMDWWARCCLHSCARGSFEGEYVDQSILNLMPVYFEGVHVLRHKGCNLAIWNRHECKRVMQPDGSVKIEDRYPVVFIHFSAGIPRFWDPLLGSYMDRFLAALRRYDEGAWEREIKKRKPGRDTYIEQKSSLYLSIKRMVVNTRLTWFSHPTDKNIAIIAHAGTAQHCLGLWLRQVPGTILSGIPVKEWSRDGFDTLDEKIAGFNHVDESGQTLDNMLATVMTGRQGDKIFVNWSDWSSLIRIKRMILNFPEGSLCWPKLAEIISRNHKVITLVSHPGIFAERMMAMHGDGRSLRCMEETNDYLRRNPERIAELGSMHPAMYSWVIKWCLDMRLLESLATKGGRVILLRDEDLLSNTRHTLNRLQKALAWNWAGDIGSHFTKYCCFREKMSEDGPDGPDAEKDPVRVALNQLIQSFGIQTYAGMQTEKVVFHSI